MYVLFKMVFLCGDYTYVTTTRYGSENTSASLNRGGIYPDNAGLGCTLVKCTVVLVCFIVADVLCYAPAILVTLLYDYEQQFACRYWSPENIIKYIVIHFRCSVDFFMFHFCCILRPLRKYTKKKKNI